MDAKFIGAVINALPLDKMIGGPLQAMISAQIQASKAYADFLLSVCIQEGKAVAVQFDYEETVVDAEGNGQGVLQKFMRIPLMAAVAHPIICIEEGTIDFEVEVSQLSANHSESETEASLAGRLGWGPFNVSINGRISHKAEQTRKSDTRAKYSIHTVVRRQPIPEALSRVLDFLTEAMTVPLSPPWEDKNIPKTLPPTNKSGMATRIDGSAHPPVADKPPAQLA